MPTDPLTATFAALADPGPPGELARLARGDATVKQLAERFAISGPAISRHLRVLERARLISRGRDRQSRPRHLTPGPIKEQKANPVRAKLVRRGRAWPWSSLWARVRGEPGGVAAAELLDDWPVHEPPDWEKLVDAPQDPAELEQLRAGVTRGRPLGDRDWVARTARSLGLEFTLRGRARPRKKRDKAVGNPEN